MGTHLMPVHRKPLVDPAACGVRLGVELRTAAEQIAWSQGLCLSHWIKSIVEKFVAEANGETGPNLTAHPEYEMRDANARAENARKGSRGSTKGRPDTKIEQAVPSAFDVAYAAKMEELKP